jgi:hypothetical protein
VTQHLVNRNSSATTDVGAVRLHPDHVTAVVWWEHPDFGDRVAWQPPNSSPSTRADDAESRRDHRGGEAASDRGGVPNRDGDVVLRHSGRAVSSSRRSPVCCGEAALERRIERLENDGE